MTSQQKFISIIYFMPMLLLFLPIKPPQAPLIFEIKTDDIGHLKDIKNTPQPSSTPTPDIRTGQHGVTNDERAIIKLNLLTRWDESQWPIFEQLIQNESGWIAGRLNKSSGACGLGQALPCSKYTQEAELGDAINEAYWSMDYIQNRYGNPKNALSSWQSRSPHWY